MLVNKKVFISTFFVLGILLLLQFLVVQCIVLPNYESIQQDEVLRNLNRLYWFSVNWTNPLFVFRLFLPLASNDAAFGGTFSLGFLRHYKAPNYQ